MAKENYTWDDIEKMMADLQTATDEKRESDATDQEIFAYFKKKITTWDDIEKTMSGLQSAAHVEETTGQIDQEQLAHFKQMFLKHLDSIPVDKGTITDYTKWADIINEKVCDFHDERSIYPNILLANRRTFNKIDAYLKEHPDNLLWDGIGEPPEFDGLSEFAALDYNLVFCLDNTMKTNSFQLVFDETPDFDGEPVVEYYNYKVSYVYKKAA